VVTGVVILMLCWMVLGMGICHSSVMVTAIAHSPVMVKVIARSLVMVTVICV
jgi:hypothetical protein